MNGDNGATERDSNATSGAIQNVSQQCPDDAYPLDIGFLEAFSRRQLVLGCVEAALFVLTLFVIATATPHSLRSYRRWLLCSILAKHIFFLPTLILFQPVFLSPNAPIGMMGQVFKWIPSALGTPFLIISALAIGSVVFFTLFLIFYRWAALHLNRLRSFVDSFVGSALVIFVYLSFATSCIFTTVTVLSGFYDHSEISLIPQAARVAKQFGLRFLVIRPGVLDTLKKLNAHLLLGSAFLGITFTYALILMATYCSLRVLRKNREVLSSAAFAVERMYITLLTVDQVLWLLFVLVPSVGILALIYSEACDTSLPIGHHFFSLFCVYPLADCLAVLIFMRPYREALVNRIIKCRCKRSSNAPIVDARVGSTSAPTDFSVSHIMPGVVRVDPPNLSGAGNLASATEQQQEQTNSNEAQARTNNGGLPSRKANIIKFFRRWHVVE